MAEDFVAALYDDFQDHGSAAIAACRAEKPDVYVRVIASLLPKDMTIKVQQLDDLTDDQLMRKLAVLTEMAKPLLARLPLIDGQAVDVSPVGADVGAEPEADGKIIFNINVIACQHCGCGVRRMAGTLWTGGARHLLLSWMAIDRRTDLVDDVDYVEKSTLAEIGIPITGLPPRGHPLWANGSLAV